MRRAPPEGEGRLRLSGFRVTAQPSLCGASISSQNPRNKSGDGGLGENADGLTPERPHLEAEVGTVRGFKSKQKGEIQSGGRLWHVFSGPYKANRGLGPVMAGW